MRLVLRPEKNVRFRFSKRFHKRRPKIRFQIFNSSLRPKNVRMPWPDHASYSTHSSSSYVLCSVLCSVLRVPGGERRAEEQDKQRKHDTTANPTHGKKKKREIELRYVGIHCMFFEKLKLLRVDGLWVWWVNEYVSIYVRTRYQI